MKKLLMILSACTLTATGSLTAVACTEAKDGKDGVDGKNAYELAVEKRI